MADATDDDLLVMSPGDERAQKVARAIGSPTAGEILRRVGEGTTTASDLATALSLPMSTVKYHLGNLLDAGVLEVAGTRYSVKGREVKIYRIRDQVVILAPPHTSVRSLLLKYASLFGITIAASAISAIFLSLSTASKAPPAIRQELGGAGGGAAAKMATAVATEAERALPVPTQTLAYTMDETVKAVNATGNGAMMVPVQAPAVTPAATPAAVHGTDLVQPAATAAGGLDLVLAFFLGGCLVIAAIIIWDLYSRRTQR